MYVCMYVYIYLCMDWKEEGRGGLFLLLCTILFICMITRYEGLDTVFMRKTTDISLTTEDDRDVFLSSEQNITGLDAKA